MTVDNGETHDILLSPAFARALLESERRRVVWTLGGLLVLAVFIVIRNVTGGVGTDALSIGSTVLAFAIAFAYEGAVLVLVGRRLREGAEPRRPLWVLNAGLEAAFPTGVILLVAANPVFGPFAALVLPAVYLYFLLFILSTLRLDPALCRLSGAVASLGYLLAAIAVFSRHPGGAAESAGAFPFPYYVSGAFLILVGGFLSGAVAGQIRGHLVTAIREAQARQEMVLRARHTIIAGLAKLAEYRDTDTGTHLERIAVYCETLAQALREEFDVIDDDWIRTLKVASSMHDIGKVGVPDDVLLKPGRLNDDERLVIQRHPDLGADALRSIEERMAGDPLIAMSIAIAEDHHERWDGAGYPQGREGGGIGLAARIVSVADVYDALTSQRVYKPAMSHEKASSIIEEGRGTQFDPAVVDAFLRVHAEFDALRRRYHEPSPGEEAT